MLTNPSFPERLRGGSPLLTAWCGMPDPSVAGIMAREAFDAVVLDVQHGSDGALVVPSADPAAVGAIAATAGLALTDLRPLQRGLEDLFFQLTAAS